MSTGFQEFLRQKAEQSGVRERNRNRAEWLLALNRLFEQIRGWLRSSDPENLIDAVPYEVQLLERRLGIYDAPALKILLGANEVDVVPVGRFSIGPVPTEKVLSHLCIEGASGTVAGRVDIKNKEKRHLLIREVSTAQDRWFAVDGRSNVAPLDHPRLETILQDLWS